MNIEFQRLKSEDMEKLAPYFSMRPNKTCDSGFLDSFLWRDYYQVRYALVKDEAVIWRMQHNGEIFSAMPCCPQEKLKEYFMLTQKHFNEVLAVPLKIHLADEEAVSYLGLKEHNEYTVEEQEDFKDYLYDGNALRTLAGKKLHKKKNQVNRFMREYEGRFEYRSLVCEDKQIVWKFLDKWFEGRDKNQEGVESLESEVKGIHDILKNCCCLEYKSGGIFIDGELEAFSIGSYNPREEMAVICIEKANPSIPGIYQVINQQFLLHEYPDAKLVNREDDVGLEGLRKAKLSYQPIGYARKYSVEQKIFDKRP